MPAWWAPRKAMTPSPPSCGGVSAPARTDPDPASTAAEARPVAPSSRRLDIFPVMTTGVPRFRTGPAGPPAEPILPRWHRPAGTGPGGWPGETSPSTTWSGGPMRWTPASNRANDAPTPAVTAGATRRPSGSMATKASSAAATVAMVSTSSRWEYSSSRPGMDMSTTQPNSSTPVLPMASGERTSLANRYSATGAWATRPEMSDAASAVVPPGDHRSRSTAWRPPKDWSAPTSVANSSRVAAVVPFPLSSVRNWS